MKPPVFNYADHLRLQAEMDKHNEYTNALKAENERLKLQRPIEVEENTIVLACECSQLKQQLATVTAERDAAVYGLPKDWRLKR